MNSLDPLATPHRISLGGERIEAVLWSALTPDDDSAADSSASADGGDSQFSIQPLERVIESNDNPGSTATCGMPQGNRSSVDIDLFPVPAQDPFIGQHLRRKRLVHLTVARWRSMLTGLPRLLYSTRGFPRYRDLQSSVIMRTAVFHLPGR